MNYQTGIMEAISALARYQFFRLKPGADARDPLQALAEIVMAKNTVLGLAILGIN